MLIDIDDFKKVNDTYGHQTGDHVIRACAKLLKESAREIDTCGRYGGEEFVVLMPNTDAKGALHFAERLRLAIAALTVSYADYQVEFTVSLGICELDDKIETPQQWLELADQALYQSKEGGRNLTSVWEKN